MGFFTLHEYLTKILDEIDAYQLAKDVRRIKKSNKKWAALKERQLGKKRARRRVQFPKRA